MPDDLNPDPAEGQSGEGEDRPDWLPEKFDNVEAFAESYDQLEKKLTSVGQEKSGLEVQLDDLYGRIQHLETERSAPQNPNAGYDPNQDPYVIAYESAMEQGDYRAALAIQTGLAQHAARREAAQVASRAPAAEPDWDSYSYIAEQMAINEVGGVEEWEQYKDAVAQEAAQENFDGLSPQQAAKKLARLHRMVRGEAALNNQQSLTEKRQEADRLAKIQAQSLSGTPSPFQEPTKDEAAVAGILRAAKEGGYESLVNG